MIFQKFSNLIGITPESAKISTDGLFLNTDAGFDSKDFCKSCDKVHVNANIGFNKRNGDADRNEYFDKKLYGERYADRAYQCVDGQLRFIVK